MKRNFFTLTVMLVLICLSSCNKNHTKQFTGNYTFKTTGTFDIVTPSTTVTLDKFSEIGQLHIIDIGDKSKVNTVKNILAGDVITTEATCNEGEIYFEPVVTKREITLGELSGTLNITSIATGKIYLDKKENRHKIIMTEEYSGYFKGKIGTAMVKGNIENANINTIATLNKE